MGRTGFVYHPAFSNTIWAPGIRSRRIDLRAIVSRLQSTGTFDVDPQIEPDSAADEWITQIHTRAYVQTLKTRAPASGRVSLDADTSLSPGSLGAAYLAAGGALWPASTQSCRAGSNMCFVPCGHPGHHAEAGARWDSACSTMWRLPHGISRRHHRIERVLIVDWDVHHGNGTQHSFDDDASVLFFSTHQYPNYPGTGRDPWKRGRWSAEGIPSTSRWNPEKATTPIVPFFLGSLVPAADKFKPEFVIISAGFDAHCDDPLASMGLTDEGYAELTTIVTGLPATMHRAGFFPRSRADTT